MVLLVPSGRRLRHDHAIPYGRSEEEHNSTTHHSTGAAHRHGLIRWRIASTICWWRRTARDRVLRSSMVRIHVVWSVRRCILCSRSSSADVKEVVARVGVSLGSCLASVAGARTVVRAPAGCLQPPRSHGLTRRCITAASSGCDLTVSSGRPPVPSGGVPWRGRCFLWLCSHSSGPAADSAPPSRTSPSPQGCDRPP